MGKGFNNYMCKKFFHPGSRDNLKRVWMAQQKTEADKKKQEELKAQYEKEQDLYVNKSMVSKESKEKLSVNFLYEPPPGMKKEREKEDGEPEFKFEWQRKYNAPREDYCRGNDDICDQPFGIAVRNVRCIKCHKWGHVNTDRECPLFNKARDEVDEAVAGGDPSHKLMNDMKETGLAMTRSAINTLEQMAVPMQELLRKVEPAAEEEEMAFLKTLSTKDKKKLLKKLEKLENKDKKKKKRREKRKKRARSESSSSSQASSSSEEEEVKPKRPKDREESRKKHDNSDVGISRNRDRETERSRRRHDSDEEDVARSSARNRSRSRERDQRRHDSEVDKTSRLRDKDGGHRRREETASAGQNHSRSDERDGDYRKRRHDNDRDHHSSRNKKRN